MFGTSLLVSISKIRCRHWNSSPPDLPAPHRLPSRHSPPLSRTYSWTWPTVLDQDSLASLPSSPIFQEREFEYSPGIQPRSTRPTVEHRAGACLMFVLLGTPSAYDESLIKKNGWAGDEVRVRCPPVESPMHQARSALPPRIIPGVLPIVKNFCIHQAPTCSRSR